MSTRNKLVVLLFASLFGIILLFGGFIYYNIIEYSYEDFHARLHTRAVTTAKIELESNNEANYLKRFKAEYLEKLTNESHHIIELDKIDTRTLSNDLEIPESFLRNVLKNKEGFYSQNTTFYNAIVYESKGKGYLVLVSAENYYHTHHEVYLRQLLVGTIIFAFLLVFFLAYWMSARITKPLNEMTEKVNEIGTENLHQRLPENNRSVELEILSRSFNVMLDRLETAFEAQNNFVSNASHELRTPLTAIIAEADLALSRDRNTESYQETLQVILSEAEKLNHKTQALLFLAQTGFRKSKLVLDKVRVDELLMECKKNFNKIEPDNKIHIDFSNLPENHERLLVVGNKQLLLLALSNLISNGIKYSTNEIVEVKISWDGPDIIITVEDKGIGIPESELPFIFDPFYRASNVDGFEGYGIGLPLARNIIRLHKGELHIMSASGAGVKVEIRIPLRRN